MTAQFADEMLGWVYPPPYERYSMADATIEDITAPDAGYLASVDASGDLVGFRSFGPDGRVPGGAYDDSALDTGGGLRPDLTGRGLGRAAIGIGIDYAWSVISPPALRVTVWEQNERALRVVRSLGFCEVDRFAATTTGDEYVILTLPSTRSASSDRVPDTAQ